MVRRTNFRSADSYIIKSVSGSEIWTWYAFCILWNRWFNRRDRFGMYFHAMLRHKVWKQGWVASDWWL